MTVNETHRSVRIRHRTAGDRVVPGGPPTAHLTSIREIDELGLIASGWIEAGHPEAGPNGSRVVWGAGLWLATMDSASPMSEATRIDPGRAAPSPFLVRAPYGHVRGLVDQPGLSHSLNPRKILAERRLEKRQVRLRTDTRTWWLLGGRRRRLTRDDGLLVLSTKGSRWSIDRRADGLDYSVAVLAVTSLDLAAYSSRLPY